MKIDSDYDPCAWGSHLPALLACVGATGGPVLELGIGHFSTPHLHALCGAMRRLLVSVEEEEKWMNQFRYQYQTKTHQFSTGKYQDLIPGFLNYEWSLIFIDHSGNRLEDFKVLLPHCEYMVVHDYHREIEEGIKPFVPNNAHITKWYEPPTLVCSLNNSIPSSLLAL